MGEHTDSSGTNPGAGYYIGGQSLSKFLLGVLGDKVCTCAR